MTFANDAEAKHFLVGKIVAGATVEGLKQLFAADPDGYELCFQRPAE
jgi:hypothetical protein